MPTPLFCPECHATNDPTRTHCCACQRLLSPENTSPGQRARLESLRSHRSTHPNRLPLLQDEPRIPRRRVLIGLGALTVVGGTAGGLFLWLFTPLTPQPAFIYRGHSAGVTAVAWSPDGKRLASSAFDRTVQVWNAVDGSHVFTYHKHFFDAATGVAWSPDSQRIASSESGVYIWDAEDGGQEVAYRDQGPRIDSFSAVAWSPDGKYLVGGSGYPSFNATVYVWDAMDGSDVFLYQGHPKPGYINGVAWSPDGQRIASAGSDGTVQVWDALTGANAFIYQGHVDFHYDYVRHGSVTAVTWSPDGKRIASAGIDTTVQVWDALDGGHVFIYRGHTPYTDISGGQGGYPTAVAWSADGTRLASAGNHLLVWDAATGKTLSTYSGVAGPLAWSPDGTRIAVAADDHTVQIWQTRV